MLVAEWNSSRLLPQPKAQMNLLPHPLFPQQSQEVRSARTPNKPWYRASKDAWYVEFNGRQLRLAKGQDNYKAPLDAFYKLMASGSGKIGRAHV